MLLQNLLTQEHHQLSKLVNKLTHNQEPLTDISEEIFTRGDKAVSISGHTYNVLEWDTVILGYTAKLFQTSGGHLFGINIYPELDFFLITKDDFISADTNATSYRFTPFTQYNVKDYKSKVVKAYLQPKPEFSNKVTEKVVGTTFTEHHDITDFTGEDVTNPGDTVPVKEVPALIIPDPNNQYDSGALAVVTQLTDGSAFRLGYIGKSTDPKSLYQTIKSPIQARVIVTAYSDAGDYNDSYHVTVDF